MADYFTRFSFVFPLRDPLAREQALALAALAENHRFEEAPTGFPAALADALEDWSFETEEQKEGLWLHSEHGGVDAACDFIRHLLQQFNPAGHVAFEWSHDCSKPRLDAYGGGAAIVTATNISILSTSQWLQEQEVNNGAPLPAKDSSGEA